VDFGIAKVAESSQKTKAGAMGYTPGFAPPEQAGGGRTGPYTDQYSLAATIYTLLTGTRPVDSVKRILEGVSVEDARVLNQEIPENVSIALGKAMALHPDDRFEDVQSFYSALIDPEFHWPEDHIKPQPQSNLNKTRPAWMMAAFGLIGLLVVTILAVAVIAAYGLIKPVNLIPPTSTQTVTEQLIPSASKVDATNATSTSILNPIVATEITPTKNVGDSTGQPAANIIASGKWIAFSSDHADGSTLQIWLMNVGLNNDGKPVALQQKQLTGTPGNKTQTAWSPEGKFLLFSAPSLDKANGLDIWRISVDGGEAVDLSNRKGDDLNPAWSPDGNLINFTNKGREDGSQQLYLMDSNGKNQRGISTDYDESQGAWSLDMTALLYVIKTSNISYFFQRLSGGEYKTAQPYDNNQVYGRLGQVTDPAFSPDGSLLAYTRSKGRDRRIGVVDYQSRGANFNLLTNTGKDYDPAWSADGKWIVFTSERDGNPEIYIMSSAGLIQTNVSKSPSRDSYPAWQP
jgi:Tol biopolymer transport system component